VAVAAVAVAVTVATLLRGDGDPSSGRTPAARALLAREAPCTRDPVGASVRFGPAEATDSQLWQDGALHARCDGYPEAVLGGSRGPYPTCTTGCPPVVVAGPVGLEGDEFALWTNAPRAWRVRVTALCSDGPATSEAVRPDPSGVVDGRFDRTLEPHCIDGEVEGLPPGGAPLVVARYSAIQPLAAGRAFRPPRGWTTPRGVGAALDDARATLNVLTGSIQETTPSLAPVAGLPRQTHDDGVFGPFAHVPAGRAPLGLEVVAVRVGTTDGFPSVGHRLLATLFPCGPGRTTFTVCPAGTGEAGARGDRPARAGDRPVRAGELLVVQVVLDRAVRLDGDVVVRIAARAAGERTWEVRGVGGAWALTGDVAATGARAMIRNNAVTLALPVGGIGRGNPEVRVATRDARGRGTQAPGTTGWIPAGRPIPTAAAASG
jgi:hypothetical protein